MKDLLSVCDIKGEVEDILKLAEKMKNNEFEDKPLDGKTLAMIFEKSSTRTRVSFDVGMYQLGGKALFLSSHDLQMGRGEPISDTAKVLSRFVDGIMIRAIKHSDVQELAKYAEVPVINGLTNVEHPCQALADMLTVKEHLGGFKGKKLTFVGDGNNVCNSLLLICPILGMDMTVACMDKYAPDKEILEKAQKIANENNCTVNVTSDLNEAIDNSSVVYTDVWVSMGDENQESQRMEDFKAYQVNKELMSLANPDAIFMHCLPAIRGQEVTSDVIDGPQSVVFDEAENRLHAQKAVLYHYLKWLHFLRCVNT